MSDTQKPTLPEDMIDKLRDEWHKHDARVLDDGDYGWIWLCECGTTGAADNEDDCTEDAERHDFSAALAAALDGCEVRPEWLVEVDFGNGFEPRPWIYHTEADVKNNMRAIVKRNRLKRRLTIITPWVWAEDVPTKGQAPTGDLAGRSEEQTP